MSQQRPSCHLAAGEVLKSFQMCLENLQQHNQLQGHLPRVRHASTGCNGLPMPWSYGCLTDFLQVFHVSVEGLKEHVYREPMQFLWELMSDIRSWDSCSLEACEMMTSLQDLSDDEDSANLRLSPSGRCTAFKGAQQARDFSHLPLLRPQAACMWMRWQGDHD